MKNCFAKIAVIFSLLVPLAGFAQSARLLTTLTNSTPGSVQYLGHSVAAMGNDRMLVGAPGNYADEAIGGVVCLIATNGTLLATFTNPTMETDDEFGRSLAALGNDRVLIGAPYDNTGASYAGVAYLYSTNGTLLTTITNPAPSSDANFGFGLAPLGSDRVLVGAPYSYASQGAYLFTTNGTLLTSFTNPASGLEDHYGLSVAALGSDGVLVGAPFAESGGQVHLFSTNGTWITTLYNPDPPANTEWKGFGWSLTPMGSDRVLIGAPYAGRAYLFSTNGTLLSTFTPVGIGSYFGVSVAALGSDRVLIGSDIDGAGAFLFNTNGTLLAVIGSPSPVGNYRFAMSVAALDSNRVLIGSGIERAFLFSLEVFSPRLSVTRSGGSVIVSWPRTAEGYVLEETLDLAPLPAATAWSQVPPTTYQTNATSIFITLLDLYNQNFYRLRKP